MLPILAVQCIACVQTLQTLSKVVQTQMSRSFIWWCAHDDLILSALYVSGMSCFLRSSLLALIGFLYKKWLLKILAVNNHINCCLMGGWRAVIAPFASVQFQLWWAGSSVWMDPFLWVSRLLPSEPCMLHQLQFEQKPGCPSPDVDHCIHFGAIQLCISTNSTLNHCWILSCWRRTIEEKQWRSQKWFSCHCLKVDTLIITWQPVSPTCQTHFSKSILQHQNKCM